ncbi:hypothetical protein QFZ87_003640 [Bacillus sp. SLBN-46]|uniref:hypothetical protein n=1 Tax=Bacillus sp. SLBN-46 TaxID=3042283 RepID=UPI002857302F|nr:hypothetical protein [Bacillus sp. SLBN-46]MDR6124043.1 hypothetical protein [Bacillus sp. SLBN-46]
MPTFRARFYLASNPDKKSCKKEHVFPLSTHLIGNNGQLFSGTLITHLGQHFKLYTSKIAGPIWYVYNTSFGIKTGKIEMQEQKHKSSAVSGNIGESVVIPGISSSLGRTMNTLAFHRLKAYKLQCPDFRIYLSPSDLNKLWKTRLTLKKVVPDLPLEVKSSLSPDNYYPVEALQQLYRYWTQCPRSSHGFGIIARVYIKHSETIIRYYLFIPKKTFSMTKFKNIADGKGKAASKPDAQKKQSIVEEIGGLFY